MLTGSAGAWGCLRWHRLPAGWWWRAVVLVAQDGDSTLLSVVVMSLFWFLARALLGGDVDTGHFSPPRRPSGARLCGEAQEIGSSYFCSEQGADINEQLINNTGLDGCSVSVPN